MEENKLKEEELEEVNGGASGSNFRRNSNSLRFRPEMLNDSEAVNPQVIIDNGLSENNTNVSLKYK